MTTPEDRVREQLVHDLELAHEKRAKMADIRPPIWRSFRFAGLMIVFLSALAWSTETETGGTIGLVAFIIGVILMMVPRGAGLGSIFRWDGGLRGGNPSLELRDFDQRIEAMEAALAKLDEKEET